jgi:hypothetical protein
MPELFRDPACYRPSKSYELVRRDPFTSQDLEAIYKFCAVVSLKNRGQLFNLLGMVLFEKHVSCAALFDWLIEIAQRAHDAELIEWVADIKAAYIGPESMCGAR